MNAPEEAARGTDAIRLDEGFQAESTAIESEQAAFPVEAYVVAVNPIIEQDVLECALSGTSFFTLSR